MGWWTRLRHSRGYGVHSPFAYALIMEAIREAEGYDYYDYALLPSPRQRLLYRLAAYFDPDGIESLGAGPAGEAAVMACARKSSRRPSGMVVADASHLGSEPLDALRRGAIVIVSGRGPLERAVMERMDAMGRGMTFSNSRDLLIAAPLPHLPRQHFEVRM